MGSATASVDQQTGIELKPMTQDLGILNQKTTRVTPGPVMKVLVRLFVIKGDKP